MNLTTADFCRMCRGSGLLREDNGDGTFTSERCFMCDGTGRQTVLIRKDKK